MIMTYTLQHGNINAINRLLTMFPLQLKLTADRMGRHSQLNFVNAFVQRVHVHYTFRNGKSGRYALWDAKAKQNPAHTM